MLGCQAGWSTSDCVPSIAANETAFVPTVVGVFTWFAVGRYNSGNDLLNTFQAVLGSDPGATRLLCTADAETRPTPPCLSDPLQAQTAHS